MSTITLIYIILAVLLSIVVGFIQYYLKEKNPPKIHIVLFILKVLSLFLLLLLLINPKIKIPQIENIKPRLSLLVDNSLSTKFFKEEKTVSDIVAKLTASNKLKDKFDVRLFSFGTEVKASDSLTYNDRHTNISKAIQSVNELSKDNLGAVVLISDGNQTIGQDYEFTSSGQSVFPIVIGDTTNYEDIRISQLNVNKYSYLNNKFPVEAYINYEGKKNIKTQFNIYKAGRKVFSKNLTMSPSNNSIAVSTNLTSNKEGVHYYSASVTKINREKNTKNNRKNFSVEVINQQTKVLLLTSIYHPDIGALKKAIEKNKQRNVEIAQINTFKGNVKDYQFVILYQPNGYFKKVMEDRASNFLLITGGKTDWNFLNSLNLGFRKEAIYQTENYAAAYNDSFLTFIQKDIGFTSFAPLKDRFGVVNAKGHQTLLYQKLKGIATKSPLIATFEKGENKFAVIFGEGIWKWRSASYLKENSFEPFDEFINTIVQYLASNKKRKRLDVSIDNLYLSNQPIVISALYLDNNFKFDNRASIQLTVVNEETKDKKVYPFSLLKNAYQTKIEGLAPGNYKYSVKVEGQNIVKNGKFKIADFQIEEQFSNANDKKLLKLAAQTKGKGYYKGEEGTAINDLINNKNYYTVQKTTHIQQNLIDWKWILFVVVALLAVEWFLRKYFGKI